jgi:hypothetical protein
MMLLLYNAQQSAWLHDVVCVLVLLVLVEEVLDPSQFEVEVLGIITIQAIILPEHHQYEQPSQLEDIGYLVGSGGTVRTRRQPETKHKQQSHAADDIVHQGSSATKMKIVLIYTST